MAKILIIGNGFDLFHHLPTKYQHFMSVMKTIENNQFDNDISFDELFGHEFKMDTSNDYSAIVDNYKVSNILFNHDKVNRIKEMLKGNLWYKYFSTVLEIDTWIDFEVELENILKQFSYFYKLDNKWEIKDNGFNDELIVFNDFQLFNIIQVLNPQGSFKLNENYINKRNSSIDVKKMLEDLAKSFEGFIMIFNRYLVDIVSVFYENLIQKYVIPLDLITEIYTFNYTSTLESIYGVDKSKVIYLHGKINEDCQKQNLVLGVSEISDNIKGEKAYDFTKYYQKVTKRANKKFIKIPVEKTNEIDGSIFYIIGHSLDESDKEYIKELFKFLEYDIKGNSKVCVFYHSGSDRENKIKNLLSIIDKHVIIEMEKMGRLYFVELNSENIVEEFNRILYRKPPPMQIRL